MRELPETGDTRSALIRLAESLLRYYDVAAPPVPVEQMLKEPPAGLTVIDLTLISSVMEHGLFSHEPRMAMARLLCREIAQSAAAKEILGVDVSPSISYAEMKFFARRLLMPAPWLHELVEQGLSIDQLSEHLQVPAYAVVTRLAEIGLTLRDME